MKTHDAIIPETLGTHDVVELELDVPRQGAAGAYEAEHAGSIHGKIACAA
jgi:hypothetical protein